MLIIPVLYGIQGASILYLYCVQFQLKLAEGVHHLAMSDASTRYVRSSNGKTKTVVIICNEGITDLMGHFPHDGVFDSPPDRVLDFRNPFYY